MNKVSVRFIPDVSGGHTRVRVFAGKDAEHRAMCGDLIFRNEEWDLIGPQFATHSNAGVEVVVDGVNDGPPDVYGTVRPREPQASSTAPNIPLPTAEQIESLAAEINKRSQYPAVRNESALAAFGLQACQYAWYLLGHLADLERRSS